jgi:hemimethylated DNA binding protein
MEQKRQIHSDRTHVLYHVGQVVSHRLEKYRGVIVDWDVIGRKDNNEIIIINNNNNNKNTRAVAIQPSCQPSSLTLKNYNHVQPMVVNYQLLVNMGAVNSFDLASYHIIVLQSDLVPVHDATFCRVHNTNMEKNFQFYDIASNSFIPKSTKVYEYPLDLAANIKYRSNNLSSVFVDSLCHTVNAGVRDVANQLLVSLSNEITRHDDCDIPLLLRQWHQKILLLLGEGNVMKELQFASDSDHVSTIAFTMLYLRGLLDITGTSSISDTNFFRRFVRENPCQHKFQLWDVIQHKIFGYRGVVVAWDYEENDTHDDYHWNDIEPTETSDEKIPYYYILLACQDYINELDETQHVQYVSEENLERC